MKHLRFLATFYTLILLVVGCSPKIQTSHVANGWARNSVNTVIFRKHSLYTFNDHQHIAFYDNNRDLILGKRQIGTSSWLLNRTQYKGNAFDAHNTISLIIDSEGYIHVSWDHHNSYLRYAKSKEPESLELGEEEPMIGTLEKVVTYPEFHELPTGDLLFAYRSGESGSGDLVINKYDTLTEKWTRLHDNLIDGEGQRNAYWQMTTDDLGRIHLSWVWRESADVASNHDMNYAVSPDGGKTWFNSKGQPYALPITEQSAEIVSVIPQYSELINQTSITTDANNNPLIASYWKDSSDQAPQYKVIHFDGEEWKTYSLDFRSLKFSLSGVGTKAIPIARPQLVCSPNGTVHLIFRDAERSSKVSVASSHIGNLDNWTVEDLTVEGYKSWEPSYDPVIWKKNQKLHLFLQNTIQVDGEGISNSPPTAIKVLEWTPKK